MTITVKKQIEDVITVETPSAYVDKHDRFYIIKEDGSVIIFTEMQVTNWGKDSSRFRDESIAEAVKGQRLDFNEAVEKLETILESFLFWNPFHKK